jgi:hypothetical protein
MRDLMIPICLFVFNSALGNIWTRRSARRLGQMVSPDAMRTVFTPAVGCRHTGLSGNLFSPRRHASNPADWE